MGRRERNLPRLDYAHFGQRRYPIVNTRLMLINRIFTVYKFGSWIAVDRGYVPDKRGPLKKLSLILLVSLTLALAPHNLKAEDEDYDQDDKPRHHKHMKASEMAGMGVGAAALVGLAGYLLLRRRHSS